MAKDRRNKKIEEKEYSKLNVGQVQATAAVEYAYIATETPTQEGDLELPVLAVEHMTVNTKTLFEASLSNHESDYDEVIKKRAALYYSSLAPTTIDNIRDALNTVVDNSCEVFGMICSAWKHQNCVLFEDEDHNPLGPILSTMASTSDAVKVHGTDRINAGRVFNFGITNNDWKKRILSALNRIYLSKDLADLLYTMMGHFIQIAPKEDGICRLLSYEPTIVVEDSDFQSLDDFATLISNKLDEIKGAYNAYPFMDDILRDLHLVKPGDKYEFTRDLAAMKLNVLGDTQNVFADMAYMLGTAFSDWYEEIDPSKYILTRLVSVGDAPAVYLSFYKNEKDRAKKLSYADRIIIDINSATNAFRGRTAAVNISFMYVKFSNNVRSVGYGVMSPISSRFYPSAISGPWDQANLLKGNQAMNEVNAWIDILDMPTDAAVLIPLNIDYNSPQQAFHFQDYKTEPRLSASDYLISEGDVDSVISDAAYCLLTGSLLVETPSNVNTLGNNGVNN